MAGAGPREEELGGGEAMDLWSSSSDEEEPALLVGRSRAESPPPLPAWRSSASKGVATPSPSQVCFATPSFLTPVLNLTL